MSQPLIFCFCAKEHISTAVFIKDFFKQNRFIRLFVKFAQWLIPYIPRLIFEDLINLILIFNAGRAKDNEDH